MKEFERLIILGRRIHEVAAHLVPYETLTLVNGQDGSESTGTAAGVPFLGSESGLWWGLRRITDLVFGIHGSTLAFDILLGFVE